MIDTYTKVVLTAIAVALLWLCARPFVQPAHAGGVVQVEGKVHVENFGGIPLTVNCVAGCK